MSLQNANIMNNGMGAGAMWNSNSGPVQVQPTQQGGGQQHEAGQCADSSCGVNRLPDLLGKCNQNFRGENTGDNVMTVSFDSDNSLSVGIWEESSLLVQECNSSSIHPGIVSINRDKNIELLNGIDRKKKSYLPILCGKIPKFDDKVDNINIIDLLSTSNQKLSNSSILIDNPDEVNSTIIMGEVLYNIQQSVSEYLKSDTSIDDKKKKKKLKKLGLGITIVLPCSNSIDQQELFRTVLSTRQAGLNLKNIFNRGIAGVAGVLKKYSDDNKINQFLTSLNLNDNNNSSIVLFIHQIRKNQDMSSNVIVEGALIQCEEISERNTFGFQRICTIALAKEMELSNLIQYFDTIVSSNRYNIAVISGGLNKSAIIENYVSIKTSDIYNCSDKDIMTGGCCLSAAELDSSKQYICDENGSTNLFYLMPIADNILGVDIGIIIEDKPNDSSSLSLEDITLISPKFKSNNRLYKLDHGVLKTGSNASILSWSKEFEWGNNYFRNSSNYIEGYPKIFIYQRYNHYNEIASSVNNNENININNKWRLITEHSPLMGVNSISKQIEVMSSTTWTLSVDPHTGVSSINNLQRGDFVSNIKKRHLAWIKFFGFILLLVGLYFSYKYYNVWVIQDEKKRHVQWLTDFYQTNNPSKLEDPAALRAVIEKYNKKMFLLWRALEKEYKVKWPAPEDILEL